MAWPLGVGMTFVAFGFVDEASPVLHVVLAGVAGGVLMGLLVGVVTGGVLAALLQRADGPSGGAQPLPASERGMAHPV